jgi:pimeloyl-ACP methyl ester carboxylesterase
MEKWIGKILIDVSSPERAKFKSPMILVHGVWTSSRCWRAWATHFANLGWECWAINFPGRFEKNALDVLQRLTFQDCVSDLKQVIRAAEFPPVLVAHDLGGLIARRAAAEESLSGLILLASLPPKEALPEPPPRALRLLRLKYAPLLFLQTPFRIEEKDFRKHWLNALPPAAHPEAFRSLVPDSAHLIREFFDRGVDLDSGSVRFPVLVVAPGEDRIAPPAALRQFAERIGAEFCACDGHGHWIMGEDGGEEAVRDMHRWIVKNAGEKILLDEESSE